MLCRFPLQEKARQTYCRIKANNNAVPRHRLSSVGNVVFNPRKKLRMHSQQKNNACRACIRNTSHDTRPAIASSSNAVNTQDPRAIPATKERAQELTGVCHVSHEGTVGTEYASAVNHSMKIDATIEQARSNSPPPPRATKKRPQRVRKKASIKRRSRRKPSQAMDTSSPTVFPNNAWS